MFKNLKRWWGYDAPSAATSEGWDSHDQAFKANAPVRYFFNETMSEFMCKYYYWPIRNPIRDKYDTIKCRILPWKRHHIIKTDLPPTYCDSDSLMLHANFKLLVDFVEVEKAWMQRWSNAGTDKPVKMWWWDKIRFRSRELGLKYLEWEMQLDDPNSKAFKNSGWGGKPQKPWSKSGYPSQAEAARQTARLYIWWKDTYLKRPDLWAEDPIRTDVTQVESDWIDEEQEALAMLVKIRKSLWT